MAQQLPPQLIPIGRIHGQDGREVQVPVSYEWRRTLEQMLAEIESLKARVAALGG